MMDRQIPQECVQMFQPKAVLHFLTEPHQQDQYLNLMNNLVKVGGYVIIADQFSTISLSTNIVF